MKYILFVIVFIALLGGLFMYFKPQLTKKYPDLVYLNPAAMARDQQRREGVKEISTAIFQYITANKGLTPKDYPTEEICIGTSPECFDLGSTLVPVYIDEMPIDPSVGTRENTGYTTYKNEKDDITVKVRGENGGIVEITR